MMNSADVSPHEGVAAAAVLLEVNDMFDCRGEVLEIALGRVSQCPFDVVGNLQEDLGSVCDAAAATGTEVCDVSGVPSN